MSAGSVLHGNVDRMVGKGRGAVLWIRVRDDVAALLEAEFGPEMRRAQHVPVAFTVGEAATLMGDLLATVPVVLADGPPASLASAAAERAVEPRPTLAVPDIAGGVVLVAELAVEMRAWSDIAAGTRGAGTALALEKRDEAAERLRIAGDDLNATFATAIGRVLP